MVSSYSERRSTTVRRALFFETRVGSRELDTNLRRLRLDKGWSQEAFAHEADLHRTYISDLERCARNPTIEVVDKLAVALGVTAGALLD